MLNSGNKEIIVALNVWQNINLINTESLKLIRVYQTAGYIINITVEA